MIVEQENHSFDNVLGGNCVQATAGENSHAPCDGATTGEVRIRRADQRIALSPMPDIVPQVGHTCVAQTKAIANGAPTWSTGFDYSQTPDLSFDPLTQQPIPAASQKYLRQHPPSDDDRT